MKLLLIATALLLGSSVVPAACAQSDWVGPSIMDYAATQHAYMTSHINGLVINGMVRRNAARGGTRRTVRSSNVRRTTSAAVSNFTYTPTAALKQQTIERLQTRLAKINPGVAQTLGPQLRQHDFGKIYTGLTAGNGLRSNDAADTLTAYTVLNYLIANNIQGNPDPTQVRAVRAQFAPQLAARNLSPAARAQMGEELKLAFVLLHSGWQAAQKEGTLKAYSDGVASGFRNQGGLDLRAVTLTNRGLQAR